MWLCHMTAGTYQAALANQEDRLRSYNLIASMPDMYYSDIEKPFIIDRNKNWCMQPNIDMIKIHIDQSPKIIFTTRPILEVMASYIAVDKNRLLKHMNNSEFQQNPDLQENENIADFMMSEYSNTGNSLSYSLQAIDNQENAGMIHIVKYEDLINTPQETMNAIYDFLERDRYDHDFENIVRLEEYNDIELGLAEDLHKVRKVLGRGDVVIEDYLTPYTIEKYKDARYF